MLCYVLSSFYCLLCAATECCVLSVMWCLLDAVFCVCAEWRPIEITASTTFPPLILLLPRHGHRTLMCVCKGPQLGYLMQGAAREMQAILSLELDGMVKLGNILLVFCVLVDCFCVPEDETE